jgi:hypothetical protein
VASPTESHLMTEIGAAPDVGRIPRGVLLSGRRHAVTDWAPCEFYGQGPRRTGVRHPTLGSAVTCALAARDMCPSTHGGFRPLGGHGEFGWNVPAHEHRGVRSVLHDIRPGQPPRGVPGRRSASRCVRGQITQRDRRRLVLARKYPPIWAPLPLKFPSHDTRILDVMLEVGC